MPTANEFEWIRRQHCVFCRHSQETQGHGVVYCCLHCETVAKNCCCMDFDYHPPALAYLRKECPLKGGRRGWAR